MAKIFVRSYAPLILVFLTFVEGCSTTADFYRDDQIFERGTIVTSTNEAVVIDRARKPQRAIPRDRFTSIDHPGNGGALAGLGLAGWGLIGLVEPSAVGCKGEQSEFCVLLTFPALVVGVSAVVYGSWVWIRSVSRAQEGPR